MERWSPTTLHEKLVRIGAKVVRRGGFIMFQLAEFAVPGALFAEVLRLIDDCNRRRYRYDHGPPGRIQVARQNSCGRRRPGCVLIGRSGPWTAILGAKSG
jgi:hypothetical protein